MGKADSFVSQWLRHRTVLLELLDLVTDEHTHFKPWEGALSLSDLAIHIAGSGVMFVTTVQTGTLTPPSSSAAPKAETMEDTRRIVRELTNQTKVNMASLTEAQLEGIVDASQTFGFSAPGKVFLHTMREHEIHHKGQLFVYARLIGLEKLPFFVNRG